MLDALPLGADNARVATTHYSLRRNLEPNLVIASCS